MFRYSSSIDCVFFFSFWWMNHWSIVCWGFYANLMCWWFQSVLMYTFVGTACQILFNYFQFQFGGMFWPSQRYIHIYWICYIHDTHFGIFRFGFLCDMKCEIVLCICAFFCDYLPLVCTVWLVFFNVLIIFSYDIFCDQFRVNALWAFLTLM